MTEVRVDPNAGFCFGVKRAVDLVEEQLCTNNPIYTFGPIVHNEEVVNSLLDRGVGVIHNIEEVDSMDIPEGAVVVIRAHGVSREIVKRLEDKGFTIADATCPFVKKIHQIVQKAGDEGKHVLITGDPVHPEVEGIVGWCNGPVTVIPTLEDAEKIELRNDAEYCLVSQTTFHLGKYKQIVEILYNKGYNDSVVSTICSATQARQTSARALAAEADIMIVIGGRNSSNTRKLYDICSEECPNTYLIQTLDDLNLELPKSVRLVGITAGASTPQNIIEEVQNNVRRTYF